MARSRIRTLGFLIVVWFVALATSVRAGLSGPPKSRIEPLPDGKHMLVFLAPLPAAEDEGRMAVLPDGKIVDLRETFPASGCYPIGSTKPLWTAPWEDIDGWTVSDDCRYLVRWNEFGDGSYGRKEGGTLSWGLKFYDRGKEIKTHNVAELVDYPSLMPFTSWDYHFDWIGYDYDDSLIIKDGLFLLHTSTHERYAFDVRTGEIVGQFRLWRLVTRTGIVLTLAVAAFTAFVVRGWRRARFASSPAAKQEPVAFPGGAARAPRIASYSLRTLLIATTAVAILCVVGRKWPHVDVLIVSLALAAALAIVTIRFWRQRSHPAGRFNRRLMKSGLSVVTLLSWLWCYLLGAAPILATLDWLDAPQDVRMALFLTVYRPLIWVNALSPLDRWQLVEWYFAG